MAIAFVNCAQASATTVSTATHSISDLLILNSFGAFSVIPTLGSGFTTPTGGTGSGNGVGWRVGSRVATATNDSSGTWTSASNVEYIGYSGASGIGACAFNSGSSATVTYPALTLQGAGTTSWVLRFAWAASASNLQTTTVTGYTRRQTLSNNVVTWDSNGPVASAASVTQSVNASGTWQSCSIEILATAAPATQGLLALF